ncbi:MAG: FeoA domain-containing protein [Lachnospiraceae bacterium]|jgi:ferrous iron transport protein A|nr:FeoA domain-containing protein [Lachnospiraceae bacterium]
MGNIILWDAELNKEYTVENILLENTVSRRLEALGINEGTPITVLTRKRSGALIAKIRGTRLALGKYITSNIEVKEVKKC